jgi:hypothetical protein
MLVITPIVLLTPLNPPDINSLYKRVTRARNIQDFMVISNFLNPVDEIEFGAEEKKEIDQEKLLQNVLSDHLGLEPAQDNNNNNNNDNMQLEGLIHLVQAAREAFQLFIKFTENQDDIQTAYLRFIERLEQEPEAIDLNSRTQKTLDN